MSSSAGLNLIISQCTQNNPSVHIYMDIKWRVGFSRLWNDGKGGVCR